MSLPVHGVDLLRYNAPPIDESAVVMDAQAITSATDYDGSFYDLGPNYSGGRSLWFYVGSTLAGGTSITFKLLSDADGVAGSEVVEIASKTFTTAALPRYVQLVIPAGVRYVKPRATSVGTYTAGSLTAQVAQTM